MVDFRYHLVSIVAVFLALATGIAIGATALNGTVTNQLNSRIRSLIAEKDKLRSEYRDVQAQNDDTDAFVKAISPDLILKKLTGRTVVIVSLPGADKTTRDQAISSVTAAGATVVAQARITDRSLDPENDALIREVVEEANADLPGAQRATLTGTDEHARLGEMLGAVLTVKGKPTAAAATALGKSLIALHEGGLVDFDANPKPAELAIVVGSQPSEGSSGRDALTIGLARALDEGGEGTIVIGPKASAQSGGSVAAIRGDARAALVVSTVDGADRPSGVLAVINALVEQAAEDVGQYGTGVGADALVATPAE